MALVAGVSVSLAVTAVSSDTALPGVGGSLLLSNDGSGVCFVRWGGGSQVATLSDLPVLPGHSLIVAPGGATRVAGVTSSGSTVLRATVFGGSPVAQALVQLPLDLIPGAVAGYSFRKIRSSYAGMANNVRRQADNVLTDVGFLANGDWDIPGYHTFIGAGTAAGVAKWYDQSANGNHMLQAVNASQPLLRAPDWPANNVTGLQNAINAPGSFLAVADNPSVQGIWGSGGFAAFVFELYSGGAGEGAILSKGVNPNGWVLFAYNNAGTWQFLIYWVAPTTAADTWISNPISLTPTRHVMTVAWSSAAPATPATITLDGVTCGLNSTSSPGGALSSETGPLTLVNDCSLNTNNQGLAGQLYEVMLWKSVPSAGVQAALVQGLRGYYGTP